MSSNKQLIDWRRRSLFPLPVWRVFIGSLVGLPFDWLPMTGAGCKSATLVPTDRMKVIALLSVLFPRGGLRYLGKASIQFFNCKKGNRPAVQYLQLMICYWAPCTIHWQYWLVLIFTVQGIDLQNRRRIDRE